METKTLKNMTNARLFELCNELTHHGAVIPDRFELLLTELIDQYVEPSEVDRLPGASVGEKASAIIRFYRGVAPKHLFATINTPPAEQTKITTVDQLFKWCEDRKEVLRAAKYNTEPSLEHIIDYELTFEEFNSLPGRYADGKTREIVEYYRGRNPHHPFAELASPPCEQPRGRILTRQQLLQWCRDNAPALRSPDSWPAHESAWERLYQIIHHEISFYDYRQLPGQYTPGKVDSIVQYFRGANPTHPFAKMGTEDEYITKLPVFKMIRKLATLPPLNTFESLQTLEEFLTK